MAIEKDDPINVNDFLKSIIEKRSMFLKNVNPKDRLKCYVYMNKKQFDVLKDYMISCLDVDLEKNFRILCLTIKIHDEDEIVLSEVLI